MGKDVLHSGISEAMEAGAYIPRAPAAARILSQFRRVDLEGFIAVAIGVLDELDGDADVEDGTDAEDEDLSHTALRRAATGPGCVISDDDRGIDDDPHDWDELEVNAAGCEE